MQKLKIWFWKTVAVLWDYRPSNLPNRYNDFPIAYRWEDQSDWPFEEFEYPENVKILYEWREKGKHWIVFSRDVLELD